MNCDYCGKLFPMKVEHRELVSEHYELTPPAGVTWPDGVTTVYLDLDCGQLFKDGALTIHQIFMARLMRQMQAGAIP